jgi:hypothetical protein
MSRTMTCGINFNGEVFRATLCVPDEYFDEVHGLPLWHKLNSRCSNPQIFWDRPIGGVPRDEVVVANVPQPIPIGEELQKLRDVVVSLEKKFDVR